MNLAGQRLKMVEYGRPFEFVFAFVFVFVFVFVFGVGFWVKG